MLLPRMGGYSSHWSSQSNRGLVMGVKVEATFWRYACLLKKVTKMRREFRKGSGLLHRMNRRIIEHYMPRLYPYLTYQYKEMLFQSL
jgi:hypothetical protein